ncbi:TAXI family TRAP transporter solute-binding subunit [Micromonospora sp. NPDC007208]|uniref:TAXI family TRAP transporter solute-binding subunit n=1 Tax=Micromonospora sp. NPDC007208 TaxID=3364236 RepID=UPI0036C6488C
MLSSAAVRRRSLLTAAAGALVAGSASCGGTPHPRGPLRIATGGRGGVYFRLGTGLVRALRRIHPELRAEVLVTAASASNVKLVATGAAEVGFTQADVLDPRQLPAVSALARLHDDYLHLVVRTDGSLRSVSDLRGQRVSLGAQGSGTEVIAERVLTAAALPPADVVNVRLGVDESAAALASGVVSAFFFSGGLPVTAIATLAEATPVRLVSLGRYVPDLRLRFGEVYAELSIPTSIYGVEPTATVALPNYLVVSPTMPAETAYALTEVLLEQRSVLAEEHPAAEHFNRREAIDTGPLPLHSGAASYFQESKP